jgi:hypothetical protein
VPKRVLCSGLRYHPVLEPKSKPNNLLLVHRILPFYICTSFSMPMHIVLESLKYRQDTPLEQL